MRLQLYNLVFLVSTQEVPLCISQPRPEAQAYKNEPVEGKLILFDVWDVLSLSKRSHAEQWIKKQRLCHSGFASGLQSDRIMQSPSL